MAKKGEKKPHREVTKGQLSRWQRERKRQRLILFSSISIIVVALGVVISGWYINQYRPLHETVIRVNETKFDMNYYTKMLKFYSAGQPSQYIQYIADQVEKIIEQDELLRQGALQLGITVSDKEIDEELNNHEPPLSKDYIDIVVTDLLANKLLEGYFDQQVPASAEHRHILAMFLESESQVAEVIAQIEGGAVFTELAGSLSLDDYSKGNNGDLGWRPPGILDSLLGTSIIDEYVFTIEKGVLSQIYDEEKIKGVGYWVLEVLERDEETQEVHVQGILLGSEEEAKNVKARLGAGEGFAALAKELSQEEGSKENGGDLGWFASGTMSSSIEEFIFNPDVEPGTISEPIRDESSFTNGGCWLLMVDDVDEREIEGENRDTLKNDAFNEWVSSLWDNSNVESYLDVGKKLWAVNWVIGH